ncbi:2OG-Fe(II) oxygenase [Oleiphilus messinensis]|uniref:2OG-Fe(II) oxygenase n=1 Tax=Oleiphilus messinensis TaxID=141451 RepID=A0A1Y0IG75_9GAMM|nr:alpha-ketoglutarate-dependent dioxygenase AlkB [Oleiphilus messinensis]ARU58384.1 2OG-Fe(II) oxygenase [Oleiphilus messinensis]
MSTGDLFDQNDLPEMIQLQDGGCLTVQSNFLSAEHAENLRQALHQELAWRQDYISMYGLEVKIPRLQAWYGEHDAQYTYSGLTLQPEPFPEHLAELKKAIEYFCQQQLPPPPKPRSSALTEGFNSVLCNLYRDEHDSVSWHSDDEAELGINPVIASFSLGETRLFQLQHKRDKKQKLGLQLGHNTLLIMSGTTQHHWRHQIPKSRVACAPRINLTFRFIRA